MRSNYERQLRSRARRLGLRLVKSHSPEATGNGTYMLVDIPQSSNISYSSRVASLGLASGHGLSLEEVEGELRERGG
jgi:hypothetical protein